jgi:hypothetical protein
LISSANTNLQSKLFDYFILTKKRGKLFILVKTHKQEKKDAGPRCDIGEAKLTPIKNIVIVS